MAALVVALAVAIGLNLLLLIILGVVAGAAVIIYSWSRAVEGAGGHATAR